MSPFKASLLLSVLTVVRAAPQELLAGRVLTHDLPVNNNLVDIRDLRALLSNSGFSLVRNVNQVNNHLDHVNHVNHVNNLRTLNHVNHVNHVNQVNQANQLRALNQVNHLNHVNHVNHVNQVNQLRSLVTPAPVAAHINHVSAVAPHVFADTRLQVNPVSHAVAVPQRVATPIIVEDSAPANYNFGYSVSDLVSGDAKTRQESRDGDKVTGSYSVADPDGRVRTVTYTADSVNGFQAKVTYDGEEGPVAIPFHPPQAVQQPLVPATQAPVLAPLSPAPAPAPAPSPTPAPVQDDDNSVIIAKDASPAQTPASTVRTRPQPLPLSNFFPRVLPAVPFQRQPLVTVQPQRLANVNSLSDLDIDNLLRLLRAQPSALSGLRSLAPAAPVPVRNLSQFRFLSNGEVVLQ